MIFSETLVNTNKDHNLLFLHTKENNNKYDVISSFNKTEGKVIGDITINKSSSYRIDNIASILPDYAFDRHDDTTIDCINKINKTTGLLDNVKDIPGIIHYNIVEKNGFADIDPKFLIEYEEGERQKNVKMKYPTKFKIEGACSYKIFIVLLNNGVIINISKPKTSTIILSMMDPSKDLVGFVNDSEYFKMAYAISKVFGDITIIENYNTKFKRKYLCVKFKNDINKTASKRLCYMITKDNMSDDYQIKKIGTITDKIS